MQDDRERGERLRAARQARGMLAKDLARATGLSLSSVSRHENGRLGISWDAAELYARELGGDPADYAEVLSPSVMRRLERMEEMLNRISGAFDPEALRRIVEEQERDRDRIRRQLGGSAGLTDEQAQR